MKKLLKPNHLSTGDTIATVSLSWGGASEFNQRYQQGKKQIEESLGLKVIEAPNSQLSAAEIYENPQLRLDDLMWAFKNPDIKAIICNIGGSDSIRLLRLMTEKHFNIIKNNPKIFMGMSDSTVSHLMCLQAGLVSFYSPCVMFGYAENGGIPKIMIENAKKLLFSTNPIGKLPESNEYIIDKVNWGDEHIIRPRVKTTPWRYIQGKGVTQGRLIGGCFDSLMECINGTTLFPSINSFDDAILFLENSEDMMSPERAEYFLRTLGAMGILEKLNGILFARPGGEFSSKKSKEKYAWIKQYPEFDKVFKKVCKEYNCQGLHIVTNMDFGHTVPQLILPYGILAEINNDNKTVSIIESPVV